MKNNVLKFLIVPLVCISVSCCGLFKKAGNGVDTSMYATTSMFTQVQLDSMCVVDNIPATLDEWVRMSYMDYETGSVINRYTFIKLMSENEEMVYLLTPIDTIFKVTKRYVKESEEGKQ